MALTVENGKIESNYTDTYQKKDTTGTSELGKDAFLQLLVTQLQYQDPLNPQDNSEMIAQLAQFSSLEAMQNLASSMSNSQALSLVGKNVIIEVGKSEGISETTTVAGYVDYVQMVDGKAKLSINDELYNFDDLDCVIDDYYLGSIIGSGNTSGSTGSTETDSDTSTDTDAGSDETTEETPVE